MVLSDDSSPFGDIWPIFSGKLAVSLRECTLHPPLPVFGERLLLSTALATSDFQWSNETWEYPATNATKLMEYVRTWMVDVSGKCCGKYTRQPWMLWEICGESLILSHYLWLILAQKKMDWMEQIWTCTTPQKSKPMKPWSFKKPWFLTTGNCLSTLT